MSAAASKSSLYPAGPFQSGTAAIIIVAAVIILAIAWAFEIIGGFTPCKLCLQQREGYYTAIPLLVISLVATQLRWPTCISRGLLVVAGLLFATSLTTGMYQAGAEWGFWLGPNDCGAGGLPAISSGNLLDEIADTQIIFCDEAAIRIVGLSFAGWNVLTAGALMIASFAAAILPANGRWT